MAFIYNSLSSCISLVFGIAVCHMTRHAGVKVIEIEMGPSVYQIHNDYNKEKPGVQV
jgi:hypothetical protein